jgi:hypothetical protein
MNVTPAKFCFGDGVNQPVHLVSKADFSEDKTRDDGLCVYCKNCNAARQRAWKHRNPEKVKAAKQDYLKRRRGDTHGGTST